MSTNVNAARTTFENRGSSSSSSDYLTNKKSKMLYCNKSGPCNNKGVSSYAEKCLIDNGRMIDAPIESLTYNLYSSLETQLNLAGVQTVTGLTGAMGSIDMTLTPIYAHYKIDPIGEMFGKTICNGNNLVKYRIPYQPLPPQTVYNTWGES